MIKIIAMDVDGTLTDGSIYIGNSGEIFKKFNVKDGFALKNAKELYNLIPVIITGRESKIVEIRAAELGIHDVFQRINDKVAAITDITSKYNVELSEIAYVGDDLNDIDAMKAVGLSFSPNDASPEVKKIVSHVLNSNGGCGAIRECMDYIKNNINYQHD